MAKFLVQVNYDDPEKINGGGEFDATSFTQLAKACAAEGLSFDEADSIRIERVG